MKIVELLKSKKYDTRLTYGDSWMWFDNHTNEWVVSQRKRHAKKTTSERFYFEHEAVKNLLEK